MGQFESARAGVATARLSERPPTREDAVSDAISREGCPDCGQEIEAPGMFHGRGSDGRAMHTHRECPNCHRLLIWFNDSDALAPGWRIDQDEERRRERREKDD